MFFRKVLSLLISLILFQGCSNERPSLTNLNYCSAHYQAESYKVALDECQIAAEQGFSHAQWLLAYLYRYDLAEDGESLDKAFFWYLEAAKQGHVGAQRVVGESYLYANGVAENAEQAYYWLAKAAEAYDASAEFNIGIMFFEGKGKIKDLSQAIFWFQRAASKNHSMSINNLAWLFATSTNAAFQDSEKALWWIEQLTVEYSGVPMFLDTKAAVFASMGQFEQAIKIQNEAIARLPEEIDEESLIEYQRHLEAYVNRQQWRE